MIILRLVHGIPRGFRPSFGGVAAGVGGIQGDLSGTQSLSGIAEGVGGITGELSLYFSSLDFSDARNSQYLALIEDI